MKIKISRFQIVQGILCIFLIFTDFFAPYTSDYRHIDYRAQPPTQVHFWHEKKYLGPFIYSPDRSPQKIALFVVGQDYKILGLWNTNIHLYGAVDQKTMVALWGTDAFGRDLLSRILLGGRVSLLLAMITAWLTIHLGMFIGAYSAVYGGIHDIMIQFLIEVFRGIPRIIILLLACSRLPIEFSTGLRIASLGIILTFLGWFHIAKWIRTRAYVLIEEEFVVCAKMLGASKIRILFFHILPQLKIYKRLFWWQVIPAMLITETTMSFFGLGIREPQSSWGLLLSDVNNLAQLQLMPWLLLPGLFLMLTNILFLWNAKEKTSGEDNETN